ncbi:acyl carrier protein [Nocardioides sp. S5]|uniref:acyl carrier protein n=1 Tax=Nocardioides sp. S5 TaxID=2017486 RepID=UPI001A8FB2C7|nr:phosphopantetheine-binding protein [Nocardioides sp. S5]QSR32546.1 acyl carrier protein [Nocardioides sp. S5]
MQTTQHDVSAVIDVLVSTLGIEDQAQSLDASTPLFGELPELDSLGVVELAAALEERFDIEVADDDVTGDVFQTVGSLAGFVAQKRTER